MNAFADLLAIEHDTGAKECPLFFVQAPDGRKDWPEARRQTVMFREMRMRAPTVEGFHIPNAGRQNPMTALASGKKAGPFDTEWSWAPRRTAWIELKGYTADGRPGKLSPEQIRWGNVMLALGHDVACFFSPHDAIDHLRSLGAPVR
jgi:hypothetical protein